MDKIANPYIGPRSFSKGEVIYGRDWEIRQLKALLVAERIVLLHSPSGAGKTSLIQAGLIPQLIEDDFSVLPIIRVNMDLPHELAGIANRHLLSTLISLEEAKDDNQRIPLQQLVEFSLDDYLGQKCTSNDTQASTVLIFDQFEEILTSDPTDLNGKKAFFAQLGKALHNRNRWALFSMREEYLGAIAPYVNPIPNRFEITFRLDLLGKEEAFQAIQAPARIVGVNFTDEATQKLVDDLRKVHLQEPDGAIKTVPGLYVEPVQLQVTCYRMWQALPNDVSCISEADIASVGDVDQSLAEYYSLHVANAAKQTKMSERKLREWFENKLITKEGFRGQATMASESKDKPINHVLRLFVDAHLVRGEKHAGITWFELTHDRLIKPILNDNAAWFKDNLNRVQIQSALWKSQGRLESLLIKDDELEQANNWALQNENDLTEIDIQFLSECNREQKIREYKLHEEAQQEKQKKEKEERRNKLIIGLSIGLVITIGLALVAFLQRQSALNRLLFLQTQSIDTRISEMQQTRLGLAIEAFVRLKDADSLQSLLTSTNAFRSEDLRIYTSSSVQSICFSPDGKVLVSETDTQIIEAWDSENGIKLFQINPNYSSTDIETDISKIKVLCTPDGRIISKGQNELGSQIDIWDIKTGNNFLDIELDEIITDFAASRDGKYIVSGSSDGRIALWNAFTREKLGHLWGDKSIYSIIFNPDGNQVASANIDGNVIVWDLTTKRETLIQTGTTDLNLIFSPDGKWLVTGGKDGKISFWDPNNGKRGEEVYLKEPVLVLAYSSNGKLLYTSSKDGAYKVWDTTKDPIRQMISGGYYGPIFSASFSPDDQYIIQGGMSGYAQVYGFGKLDRMDQPKTTYGIATIFGDGQVNQSMFSPDGKKFVASTDQGEIIISPMMTNVLNHDSKIWNIEFDKSDSKILTSSMDGSAKVWDAKTGGLIYEITHEGQVNHATFNYDGSLVATASADNTARISRVSDKTKLFEINHFSEVSDVSFSSDGRFVGTAGLDGAAHIWSVVDQTQIFTINHDNKINRILFSNDNKWVITASDDNSIQIWDLNDLKKARTLSSNNPITDIAISSNGKYIVSGDEQGKIAVWNTESWRQDLSTNLGKSSIMKVAISVDDELFAAGNQEGMVSVWQMNGKIKCGFQAEETIWDITFSQSNYVIAGSGDGYVYIWDVDDNIEYLRIGSPGMVLSVDVSSNDRYLAISDTSGFSSFTLWNQKDILSEACRRLPHQLSKNEWKEFLPQSRYNPFCNRYSQ